MAVDVADWTQAVNVTGGSVAISGTATVTISGTPTVSISGTPTVNVGNTPAVTISSGTVTANISGTPNINIQSQSVTVTIGQQWTQVTSNVVSAGGAGSFTTAAVSSLTQQLALSVAGANSFLYGLSVKGVQSGMTYIGGLSTLQGWGGFVTFPVNGILDSTYTIAWTSATGFSFTAYIHASSMPWTPVNAGLYGAWAATVSIAEDQAFINRGNTAAMRGLDVQPMAAAVQSFSRPAVGSAASVTLAAVPSAANVCQSMVASLSQVSGGATTFALQFDDGGIRNAEDAMSVSATGGDKDHIFKKGVGNSFSQVNATYVVSFNAGAAGVQQSITISSVLR